MPKEYDLALTVTLPADNPYGGEYTLRMGQCTGLDDLDVIRETGQPLFALMQQLGDNPGTMQNIAAAVVVWLERRKQYPHVTFRDIARTITWGSDFDVRDPDTDDVDPNAKVEEDAGKAEASGDSPKT